MNCTRVMLHQLTLHICLFECVSVGVSNLLSSSVFSGQHVDDILPIFKIPSVSKEELAKRQKELDDKIEEEKHHAEHHHHHIVTHHVNIFEHKTSAKFAYLIFFANTYLSNLKGYQVYSEDFKAKNQCTVSVLHMVEKLLSFGFYETTEEISEVVKPLLKLLDGRLMIPSRALLPGYDYTLDGVAPSPNISKVARYQIDDDTGTIMDSKFIILKILKTLRGIRDQIRLRKFLSVFISKKGDHTYAVDPIMTIVDDESFSLETLGKSNYVDGIFIDLLMYEDEKFFQETFRCLIEEHEPTKSLFHNAHQIHLLASTILAPPMETYDNLFYHIWELRELLETAEVWGHIDDASYVDEVTKKHHKEKMIDKYIEVSSFLIKIRSYLYSNFHSVHEEAIRGDGEMTDLYDGKHPHESTQQLLFSMDLNNVLLTCLHWEIHEEDEHAHDPHGRRVSQFKQAEDEEDIAKDVLHNWSAMPPKSNKHFYEHCSLHHIIWRCMIILHDLVNHKNQNEFVDCTKMLRHQLHISKKKYIKRQIYHLFYDIYSKDITQVLKTPTSLFRDFADRLNDTDYKMLAFKFFEQQLCPNCMHVPPIHLNQDRAITYIVDNFKQFLGYGYNTAISENYLKEYVSYLNLIVACCEENGHNRDSIRFLFNWNSLMDRIKSDIDAVESQGAAHLLLLANIEIMKLIYFDPRAIDENVVYHHDMIESFQEIVARVMDSRDLHQSIIFLKFVKSYLQANGTSNEHLSALTKDIVKKCKMIFKTLGEIDIAEYKGSVNEFKYICAQLIQTIVPRKEGDKAEWYKLLEETEEAEFHDAEHSKSRHLVIHFKITEDQRSRSSSHSSIGSLSRGLSHSNSQKSIFNPILQGARSIVPFEPFESDHNEHKSSGIELKSHQISSHRHENKDDHDAHNAIEEKSIKEEEKLQRFIKILNLHSHTIQHRRVAEDLKLMHIFRKSDEYTNPNEPTYVANRKASLMINNEYASPQFEEAKREGVNPKTGRRYSAGNNLAGLFAASNQAFSTITNKTVNTIAIGVNKLSAAVEPTDEIRVNTITYADIIKRIIRHIDYKLEVGELEHENCVFGHVMSLFILYVEEGRGIDTEARDGMLLCLYVYICAHSICITYSLFM